MGRRTHTATAVKTRWNNRHYDRLFLFVKKGTKEQINEYAQSQGMSTNQFINDIVRSLLGVPKEEWKPQDVEPVKPKEDFIKT